MPKTTPLHSSASERRRALRRLLQKRQEISLAEAQRLLGASVATVRRDFAELAAAGVAEKVWGALRLVADREKGAPSGRMTPFAQRKILQAGAKERIGRAAVALVADGDVVMIDGGTTTLQLVPHLAARRVKIVTNSIAIAHAIDRERGDRLGAEVFLTGGQLYPDSFLLVGPQACATLRGYRARWAFLSATGLDERGVSNTNELVVETEKEMIALSEQVVLLADATKFGAQAMVPLCELRALHTLVTDANPPARLRRSLKTAGVRTLLAAN